MYYYPILKMYSRISLLSTANTIKNILNNMKKKRMFPPRFGKKDIEKNILLHLA